MTYRFATHHEYSADFASGLVIRSAPGHTAFPVRLAREMFEQCRALQTAEQAERRCVIYDPCCGTGFLVTCLGLLYGRDIAAIAASDIDERSVLIASANLSLLTRVGASDRARELETMFRAYGNPSHARALESAGILRKHIVEPPPTIVSFVADARDQVTIQAQLNGLQPDIVIADVPYGRTEMWIDPSGIQIPAATAVERMLDALHEVVSDGCVLATASDSHLKISHRAFERQRQFKIGKRRLTWLVHRSSR